MSLKPSSKVIEHGASLADKGERKREGSHLPST